MKQVLVIGGVCVLLLGGAAVVVAGKTPVVVADVDWKSRRGTDGYYTGKEQYFDLPTMTVNLKGEGRFLKLSLAVEYRLGAELVNEKPAAADAAGGHGGAKGAGPVTPFDKAMPEIKDRLNLLLSNKTVGDIEGLENKKRLKEEVRHELEDAVFPERLGRIEKVFIKEIVVQ